MPDTLHSQNFYEAPASQPMQAGKLSFLPKGRLSRSSFRKRFVVGFSSAILFLVPLIIIDSGQNNILKEVLEQLPNFLSIGLLILMLVNALFSIIYGTGVLLPAYAKRLHDLGKTGKLLLLTIVPIVGIAAILWLTWICLFGEGDKLTNKYGEALQQ